MHIKPMIQMILKLKKKNRIPEVQGERTVLLINGAESAGYLYGKEKAV